MISWEHLLVFAEPVLEISPAFYLVRHFTHNFCPGNPFDVLSSSKLFSAISSHSGSAGGFAAQLQ
jgi:hypothetical protein